MRVLKAVVPLVVGVAIVGSALVVSGTLETKTAMVTGTIYTCNGVFGTTCRAEATGGLTIQLTELGLVRHTFSAVSHTDGSYLLQVPSGRYTVQLPRCKTYPLQASNIYPIFGLVKFFERGMDDYGGWELRKRYPPRPKPLKRGIPARDLTV